ncbi:hypothetical protein EWM64_g3296 [Hericium alpestre]|uniref:SLA1 homology domain-containing protein n=1 Tax=Hericium alpestre TaxID=135208 RepID=A0A4Z0A0R8_9AGAM|nr:hypothetical protein EWM64_g3296 [Hericium alpestre]
MNNFANGARVFFWDSNGTVVYGRVQSTSIQADGTQIVTLRLEGTNTTVNLPADLLNADHGQQH